jgi:hypothetical protein
LEIYFLRLILRSDLLEHENTLKEALNSLFDDQFYSDEFIKDILFTKPIISKVSKYNDTLSKLLNSHEVHRPFHVYKGISKKRLDLLVGHHVKSKELSNLVGKIVHDKGFISTSLLANSALLKHTYLLDITIPKDSKGAAISEISKVPQENEFLIDRNQFFVINKITPNVIVNDLLKDHVVTVIHCSLIPKSQAL